MDEIYRLVEWINNYFPDPTFSRDDVEKYLNDNVKGWEAVPRRDKREIMNDWFEFTEKQLDDVELGQLKGIRAREPTMWSRIKAFLKRLF